MKTRGYTLIEIAIVLVVALMLSSLLVTNYYSHQKNARNNEAERHLAQIKEAIVNYAAAHTTVQRFVDVVNVSAANVTVTVRHTIPAGRPYLPCPDIDGDGYENRITPNSVDTPLNVVVNATMPVLVNPNFYPLENRGGCASSRGIVPWRTLDSPSVDPWGNRYSYRVAGIFSNANTGFDQHATAANFVARPLQPVGENARVVQTMNLVTEFAVTFAGESGPWNAFNFFNYLAPSFVCDAAPCPPPNPPVAGVTVSLVAGVLATAEMTVFNEFLSDFDGAVETRLSVGDIVSGIPFVVLSHGENGYGGVRADTEGYVCNPFRPFTGSDNDDAYRAQIQNARWFQNAVVTSGNARYECPQVSGVGTAAISFTEAGFVAGINSGVRAYQQGREDGYDDVVDWMSIEELVDALSERGTLPARLPPPIGLEQ